MRKVKTLFNNPVDETESEALWLIREDYAYNTTAKCTEMLALYGNLSYEDIMDKHAYCANTEFKHSSRVEAAWAVLFWWHMFDALGSSWIKSSPLIALIFDDPHYALLFSTILFPEPSEATADYLETTPYAEAYRNHCLYQALTTSDPSAFAEVV